MNTLILFPMIFLAGFVDAIAGGGGLISLPSYYAAGVPVHTALGSNKFSSALSTLAAAVHYLKSGSVHLPIAFVSGGFAVVGSILGAKIALMISGNVMGTVMIVLTPVIAAFTIFNKNFGKAQKQRLSGAPLYVVCAILGLVLGAYDGFFGPGSGTFWIIALTSVVGLDALHASGTAKIANLASCLGSLATYAISGKVDYALAVPAALFGIVGGLVGSHLAVRKGAKVIRPMMLVVMGLLLVKTALETFV
ncbi:MAG: sulfite exporter TauE/SafE family protein [Christensenellales bacterium]